MSALASVSRARFRASRSSGVRTRASAVADWQLDSGYKLRSVTSVRYFRTNPTMADSFSVNIYNNTGTQVRDHTWSQELRLESPIGED